MTARSIAKKTTQKAAPEETAPTPPEGTAPKAAEPAPQAPTEEPVPQAPTDEPAPAPVENEDPQWSEVSVATGDAPGLNVRPAKSTDGLPIGSLPNGMAVLAGPDEDGWREVKGAGWVLSEYLA